MSTTETQTKSRQNNSRSNRKEEEVVITEKLIKEISQRPELAVDLIQALKKITKPWEPLGSNLQPVNEVPVPPGTNPKTVLASGSYISGFRLTTIFGDEVAVIVKDTPKWKVSILGENQMDAPFVQHGQKAEENAKSFVHERLKGLGYILG